MNQQLTQRQHDTLEAVNSGKCDVSALAGQLGVSVGAVRAQLRGLRENGLIEGTSPELSVTADGRKMLGGKQTTAQREQAAAGDEQAAHREGSKIAKARGIFEKNWEKGRKAVLDMFKSKLKMSDSGASTYYQTLRHETGVAFQQARGGKAATNRSNANDNKGTRAGNRGGKQGGKASGNRNAGRPSAQ